jgi:hypothetical protein
VKDDLEKKKYAVIEAQNDLNFAKKIYDLKRENAANQDDPGEEAAKGALRFRRQQHERFYIYRYRAALADLEKKINNAGAKWAGESPCRQRAISADAFAISESWSRPILT